MEDAKAPIFIVGANRSGTTLLRLILNAHSRIGIPEELVYFDSSLAGAPIEQWRDPALPPDAYEAFVDSFLRKSCRLLDGLDAAQLRREILDAGPFDFRRPYRRVLEAWTRHHGKARWGEKTPGNLFYADIICDMFPQARFIHLVRDPRAVVSSMMRVPFFADDVAFNTLAWRKHVTKGRAILARSVPAAQRMTLYYEALVREPETTMRTVCDFLGERFEPMMLRFHEDAEAYMKSEAASSFNAAATHSISSDKIGRWKEHLSHGQIALVEHICAPQMDEFGYETVGGGLPWAKRLDWVVKNAYWVVQSWRNRHVRHYAVKHPLLARMRGRLQALVPSGGKAT